MLVSYAEKLKKFRASQAEERRRNNYVNKLKRMEEPEPQLKPRVIDSVAESTGSLDFLRIPLTTAEKAEARELRKELRKEIKAEKEAMKLSDKLAKEWIKSEIVDKLKKG
jgi:uncharacterized membrane protein